MLRTPYLLLQFSLCFCYCLTTYGQTEASNSDQKIIYQSPSLVLQQVSEHSYVHISYLETESFGKVGCNGMVIIHDKEAIIFDSPATGEVTSELICLLRDSLALRITAMVPTHFHADCVAGLSQIDEAGIEIYAHSRTVELLKKTPTQNLPEINEFDHHLSLRLGGEQVLCDYFGEGHTVDNITAYFPTDRLLFGGCLIKAAGASKGNLEDANTRAWSETVEKIALKYPQINKVIPGHGDTGDSSLLTYTIEMFE